MGCGSSTGAAGGSTMTKDPEDFHLEHLHFKKMQVPDFDTYMCDEIEPTTNQIIDMVNTINACIDEIKEAAVIVCGGFKVEVETEGSADHDKVIVTLVKADGTYPTAEEAAKLSDPKLHKADQDLATAHKALHIAMEQSYIKLKLDATMCLTAEAGPTPEVGAFNKALGELRGALGAAYKVNVVVKEAGSGGAKCVRISLKKFKFPDNNSDAYVEEQVSVLDLARCKEAKNVFMAEVSLAEALAAVVKAVKAVEADSVTVGFEIKKKKLVPVFEGGEEGKEETADKKAAVRKAVSAANSQLFKLNKAARNANGTINIAKALLALFESLKKKVTQLAAKEAKELITVAPTLKCTMTEEGEPDIAFDFGVKVNLPDYEGKDAMEILNSLLSGPAKLVLKAFMDVKDKLTELLPQFKALADQVTELCDKASEVFAEPQEKIKAAYGEEADMIKIAKAAAAATVNMKIIATEPVKVVKTLKDTVLRLSDELTAAVNEVKAAFA